MLDTSIAEIRDQQLLNEHLLLTIPEEALMTDLSTPAQLTEEEEVEEKYQTETKETKEEKEEEEEEEEEEEVEEEEEEEKEKEKEEEEKEEEMEDTEKGKEEEVHNESEGDMGGRNMDWEILSAERDDLEVMTLCKYYYMYLSVWVIDKYFILSTKLKIE